MLTTLCATLALLGSVQAPRQVIFSCQVIRLVPTEKLVLVGAKEVGSETGNQLCLVGATKEVVETFQQLVKAEKARVISGPILRSLENQQAIVTQNLSGGSHIALTLRAKVENGDVKTEAEFSDGEPQKDFRIVGETFKVSSNGTDGKDGYRVFVVQRPGQQTVVVTVKTTLVED